MANRVAIDAARAKVTGFEARKEENNRKLDDLYAKKEATQSASKQATYDDEILLLKFDNSDLGGLIRDMESQIEDLTEEENERAGEAEAADALFLEGWEGEETAAWGEMAAIDAQYEALYTRALDEEDQEEQIELFEEADEVFEAWYEWNDRYMEAQEALEPVRARMAVRTGGDREALIAEEAFALYEEQEALFQEKEEAAAELRTAWETADEAGRAEIEE